LAETKDFYQKKNWKFI